MPTTHAHKELSSVAPKSLVTAICRRLETVGRDDFSRYLSIFGDVFEGRASCDCILKANGATDRKPFPAFGLL